MRLQVAAFTGTASEWDEFGAGQRGWTAFHRHAWSGHVHRVFGHRTFQFSARAADGALHGILTLVQVRSPIFGHFLVSMPFVSYGGPVGTDAAVRELTEAARRLQDELGADLLELRSAAPLPIDLPVNHRKITVVLELTPNDPDAVFKKFPSKLRSQVRRPAKSGVEVRIGPEQAEHFHDVFARHMRDLGTPTLPRDWFTSLRDSLGEDAWFSVAWLEGVPIAGGVGLRWDGEFEITWAAALREHASTSANMGIYWALIERAAQVGLKRFNFGRCTPGGRTHKFKSQWGAVDEALHWYEHRRVASAGVPSADSAKFALAQRVWRHLPLPLTKALGPRLVRYIP